jgi:hypothetical protein
MHRTGLFLGIIFSVAIGSASCSRADEAAHDSAAAALDTTTGETVEPATGAEVTVTGCLTAAPDRAAFVVTADRSPLASGALYSRAGGTPTYTYELMGSTGDLTAHVGRQVEVTGRLDDDRKDGVTAGDEEKTELPKVQSGDRTVEPTVETETQLAINVRRLQVTNVSPTGQPCVTEEQEPPQRQ